MPRRLGVGQADPPLRPQLPRAVSRVGGRALRGRGSGRCGAHISGPNGDPLVVRIHAGNDDRHSPGSSEAQHVGFLGGRRALGQPLQGRGLLRGRGGGGADSWSLT